MPGPGRLPNASSGWKNPDKTDVNHSLTTMDGQPVRRPWPSAAIDGAKTKGRATKDPPRIREDWT